MKSVIKKLFQLQQHYKQSKDQRNNFGQFNYRNIESMLSGLKPYLESLNAIITFSEDIDGNVMKCTCTLIDIESGETYSTHSAIEYDKQQKGMCISQSSGASISYIRKYTLCGLLAIDDGKLEIDAMNTKQHTQQPSIVNQIKYCTTISELNSLYKTIAEKDKYKTLFTARKNELIQKKQ